AAAVIGAWLLERAARLDFEQIEAAVAVGIQPLADGISEEARLQVRGPIASIGEDSTIIVDVSHQNVGRSRCDDEFHLAVSIGGARHARRKARKGRGVALSAFTLFFQASLEDGLVLRRQRRLLSETRRLVGIEARAVKTTGPEADQRALQVGARGSPSHPLALQVGI